jgi:hypothetical protein
VIEIKGYIGEPQPSNTVLTGMGLVARAQPALNQIIDRLREVNRLHGVFMADPVTAGLLEAAA